MAGVKSIFQKSLYVVTRKNTGKQRQGYNFLSHFKENGCHGSKVTNYIYVNFLVITPLSDKRKTNTLKAEAPPSLRASLAGLAKQCYWNPKIFELLLVCYKFITSLEWKTVLK